MNSKENKRVVVVTDVLYGSIELTPLLLKVVDNIYFQRLGRLLQLGVCHYVYPGATHTRKSHCLGACYLAGVWMKHFQKTQPELHISERMVEIVRLAALIHDIGHTFYSHMFDHLIAPSLDIPRKDHEERSIFLLKIMNKEEQLGLSEAEIEMISCMVLGKQPEFRNSLWPPYLFQIVSSNIDVDKLDYLRRDSYYTGVPCGFQYDRLIHTSRVIDGELCFAHKVARNVLQVLHTRYYFHSEIYQHKAALVVTAMLVDAIKSASEYLELDKKFSHDTDWCWLDDFSILSLIRLSNDKRCETGKKIINLVESRKFYKKKIKYATKKRTLYASNLDESDEKSEKIQKHDKSKKRKTKGKEIPENSPEDEKKDVRNDIITTTVGYSNENINPLTKLWFFNSDDLFKKFHLDLEDEIFTVVPMNFAEIRQIYFERH